MVDQKRSGLHVVFTEILCGHNFCVWYVMKLKFVGQFQMASPSLYLSFETKKTGNSKATNISYEWTIPLKEEASLLRNFLS